MSDGHDLIPPPSYESGSGSALDTGDSSDARAEGAQLHTTRSEPVVLSWSNQEPSPSGHASPSLAPARQAFENLSQSSIDSTPFDPPPGYAAAGIPTVPVIYTFSPLSSNSMLLLPSEDAADTRPKYHISVGLNCFFPTSHITTIRRGATEDAEYIGDFEVGSETVDKGTVCVHDREYIISQVLVKERGGTHGTWAWKFSKMPLYWQSNKRNLNEHPSASCYILPDTLRWKPKLIAHFTPKSGLRKPGQRPPLAKLEILPEGQPWFDHILISALILERKRR